jgi:hypothetical protein
VNFSKTDPDASEVQRQGQSPLVSKIAKLWLMLYLLILFLYFLFYHSNPVVTTAKCFPSGWYFKPWDTTKTHAYYMTIFEIKSSVNFKHFNLKQHHTEPTYYTSIIKDVVHLERALSRKKVVVR